MDQTYFEQIRQFASQLNTPVGRERAILREFLQSKFISTLYEYPNSNSLSFIGGTSLRLLHNLPRFSEDLDFDNLGLKDSEIKKLVSDVVGRFENEGTEIELKASIKEHKTYFEVKFPDLLYRFNISTNPREKLMIKVDYSDSWKGQKTETILFSKYGFIANVVTNPPNQLLVQKLTAYVNRAQTQGRDLYDIVWLYSQGARLDPAFMKENGLLDLIGKAKEKFAKEGASRQVKERLSPFLFREGEIKKLDLVGSVLNEL